MSDSRTPAERAFISAFSNIDEATKLARRMSCRTIEALVELLWEQGATNEAQIWAARHADPKPDGCWHHGQRLFSKEGDPLGRSEWQYMKDRPRVSMAPKVDPWVGLDKVRPGNLNISDDLRGER